MKEKTNIVDMNAPTYHHRVMPSNPNPFYLNENSIRNSELFDQNVIDFDGSTKRKLEIAFGRIQFSVQVDTNHGINVCIAHEYCIEYRM